MESGDILRIRNYFEPARFVGYAESEPDDIDGQVVQWCWIETNRGKELIRLSDIMSSWRPATNRYKNLPDSPRIFDHGYREDTEGDDDGEES